MLRIAVEAQLHRAVGCICQLGGRIVVQGHQDGTLTLAFLHHFHGGDADVVVIQVECIAGQLRTAGGDGIRGIGNRIAGFIQHRYAGAVAGIEAGYRGAVPTNSNCGSVQHGGAGVAQGKDHRCEGVGLQVGVIHHNRVHRDGSGLHRPAAGEKLIGICCHLVSFGSPPAGRQSPGCCGCRPWR